MQRAWRALAGRTSCHSRATSCCSSRVPLSRSAAACRLAAGSCPSARCSARRCSMGKEARQSVRHGCGTSLPPPLPRLLLPALVLAPCGCATGSAGACMRGAANVGASAGSAAGDEAGTGAGGPGETGGAGGMEPQPSAFHASRLGWLPSSPACPCWGACSSALAAPSTSSKRPLPGAGAAALQAPPSCPGLPWHAGALLPSASLQLGSAIRSPRLHCRAACTAPALAARRAGSVAGAAPLAGCASAGGLQSGRGSCSGAA